MDKLISYSNLGAKLCSVFRNQYHYLLCICSLLWTLDTFDLNGFDGIVLYTANSHTSSIKLCSNQSPPTVAPYFPPGCHQACVAHRLGAQSHVQIEVTNRFVAYIVCALSSITCSTYSAGIRVIFQSILSAEHVVRVISTIGTFLGRLNGLNTSHRSYNSILYPAA